MTDLTESLRNPSRFTDVFQNMEDAADEIDKLTAERDHWKAQHKECTRCLGEALQEATDVGAENDKMSDWWSQMKAERDALKDAAKLAMVVLDSYDAEEFEAGRQAIAALKAVL